MAGNPLEPRALQRGFAGIGDGDAPALLLDRGMMNLDGLVATEFDGDVVVHHLVMEEILLDDLALIAGRENEIVNAVVAIEFHDVPQDRTMADLDHRLWPELGLLPETRSQSAAQDHCLHG